MNLLEAFAIELGVTLLIGFLLLAYIRLPLYRLLVDLCGTEDRARFWSAFSAVLLIGFPTASALGYQPLPGDPSESLFLIFRQLGQNLIGFLVALVALGLVISLFALAAPRVSKEHSS